MTGASSKPSFQTEALKTVMESDLCAGCGICAGVSSGAVMMEMNDAGYLRPVERRPLSPQQEALVRACCPGLVVERPESASHKDAIWGAYETADLGWSTDPDLRHHGSSGAALSAIARYLIESGQVDFVLTNKANGRDPLSNETVEVQTREEVYIAAGSRYAPSAPLAFLEHHLQGDRRFAVIGKPCDISALRSLSRRDDRIPKKIPIMLSFFCAGVPSRKGAKAILDQLGMCEEEVTHFQFRGDGWPGSAKAVSGNGREATMSYAESWGQILSKHVQFRCKICPDGTGGSADIVCADAWHSNEKGYPLFEDAEGRSLILARTKKGAKIVEAAASFGAIEKEPFEMENLYAMQPGQTGRSKALLARLAALPLRGRHLPKYKEFSILSNALSAGISINLRNFLGMLRRL